MPLILELANAHDSGDCTCECTHPDCAWVGALDMSSLMPGLLLDDVELYLELPVVL